jgi:sugar phosphate isomerase/epimerase
MNRRQAIGALAGAATAALAGTNAAIAQEAPKKTGLGLVIYCAGNRRGLLRAQQDGFDLFDPHNFLAYCQGLGAGGMQIPLGTMPAERADDLRRKAEAGGLYIEAAVQPPRAQEDVERFDAEMQTAARCGALAARTVIIPGRRYEYFDSLEMYREHAERGKRSLELAAPIAEKHRVPLAVENHKEQRNDERIALFEHISSEYVGACMDTGNSFALLEDPIETVRAFAPWAHSVHFKDQILAEYEDGFLLGDIPLGQGAFDLKKMVEILRGAKPDIRFTLELITRDPLQVPCLTEKFWATFPDLPSVHLARTLRYVREHAAKELPYVSNLPPEGQVAREDANVRAALDYARDELGL